MNVKGQVEISGAIVFWSLCDYTDREKLNESLVQLGIAPIEKRSQMSVLQDAIENVHTRKRLLVRPLDRKKAKGFCVSEEHRGGSENKYPPIASYWFESSLSGKLVLNGQGDERDIPAVANEYRRLRETLRPQQVSAFLLNVLRARINGLRLNPNGFAYWVPETTLPLWGEITHAIEVAAMGGPALFYEMTHKFDEKGVKAVSDALAREAEAEAKEIASEIEKGTLGVAALEGRVARAREMREKVESYEGLLSSTMDELKFSLLKAENAAAMAAMLVASEGVKNA